ncbi:hypothetical protein glysoja_003529 [Glycine soja]|uniref:Isopenicillin N synthase-like Fe(2+) 2OG dioxygenase domain-containing protein n=1 Tax=Glycine max TaxID=3847 RepID=K7LNR7_SOYBN|nr:hypothetical protein glysoja_003529 [Glycine soja]
MEDTFPVIDAEKINCEEGECKKLREACERWGCFMADMKKVVEALVVTWDKMHSALYMRPWVSMTCVPHKLCRFSVLNLMTRSTRETIGVPIHTDSGFLTILKDDENAGGLQVMNGSGSFLPILPFPGTFNARKGANVFQLLHLC